jgi:hypothetical protein
VIALSTVALVATPAQAAGNATATSRTHSGGGGAVTADATFYSNGEKLRIRDLRPKFDSVPVVHLQYWSGTRWVNKNSSLWGNSSTQWYDFEFAENTRVRFSVARQVREGGARVGGEGWVYATA